MSKSCLRKLGIKYKKDSGAELNYRLPLISITESEATDET